VLVLLLNGIAIVVRQADVKLGQLWRRQMIIIALLRTWSAYFVIQILAMTQTGGRESVGVLMIGVIVDHCRENVVFTLVSLAENQQPQQPLLQQPQQHRAERHAKDGQLQEEQMLGYVLIQF